MAAHPSPLELPVQRELAGLIVAPASGDLLDVEPLDLGPGAPATTALKLERGPQTDVPGARGDQ